MSEVFLYQNSWLVAPEPVVHVNVAVVCVGVTWRFDGDVQVVVQAEVENDCVDVDCEPPELQLLIKYTS